LLKGAGANNGTVISYTATSGAAIVFASPVSGGTNSYGSLYWRGGLQDLVLLGTGGTQSTVGVYLGGDPASVYSPTAYQANLMVFRSTKVANFGGQFLANTAGMNLNQGEWYVYGTVFGDNTTDITGSTLTMNLYSPHFEKQADSGCTLCGKFIQTSSLGGYYKVFIDGGVYSYGGSSSTSTSMFQVYGTDVTFSARNMTVYVNGSLSEMFDVQPSSVNDSHIEIGLITGDEDHHIGSILAPSTNVSLVTYTSKYGGGSTPLAGNLCLKCTAPLNNAALTIGSGTTVNPPPTLAMLPTTNGSSARVSWQMDNWLTLQDASVNGIKDWALFCITCNYAPISVSAVGRIGLGPNSNYNASGNNPTVEIADARIGGATTLEFLTNSTQGSAPIINVLGPAVSGPIGWYVGNGVPSLAVCQGSMFTSTNGNFYMKQSGLCTSSGWMKATLVAP
jgi:hypothetical protein